MDEFYIMQIMQVKHQSHKSAFHNIIFITSQYKDTPPRGIQYTVRSLIQCTMYIDVADNQNLDHDYEIKTLVLML